MGEGGGQVETLRGKRTSASHGTKVCPAAQFFRTLQIDQEVGTIWVRQLPYYRFFNQFCSIVRELEILISGWNGMSDRISCEGCKDADANTFVIPFTMAFQPIVDLVEGRIWGYESLVRGQNGESAFAVLSQVTDKNRYAFDQACRVKAIALAGEKMPAQSSAMLSINFLPNAVYEPRACIRATLAAAAKVKFSPRRLMFEFTEQEKIQDTAHLKHIVTEYRKMGFTTAIDDFGAGFSGLGLLAGFQTDIVKIDMELVRNIDKSPSRQAIVQGIMTMSNLMKFKVLAEGVETEAETRALLDLGIGLFQGYFFAKPAIELFAREADIPALANGLPVPSRRSAQMTSVA